MGLLCRRVLSVLQVCAILPIRCRAMRGKLSALSAHPLRRLDAAFRVGQKTPNTPRSLMDPPFTSYPKNNLL